MRDTTIANQQLAHLDGGPCDATNQAAIISLTLGYLSGVVRFWHEGAPAGKLSSVTFTCPEVTMIFIGGHRPRT
jgi:hypothetical protein